MALEQVNLPPDQPEKQSDPGVGNQSGNQPEGSQYWRYRHGPPGGHRLAYVAIIIVVLCLICFGILVRTQNLNIASLTDSMVNISGTVHDLAEQRQAEVHTTGEKVVLPVTEASANCTEQDGQLAVAKRPDGETYGVCLFGPDRQCEEWALLEGKCPSGGVDISRFGHPADVYCAVTGNILTPSLIPGRPGTCQLTGGEDCTSDVFYETGSCDNVKVTE